MENGQLELLITRYPALSVCGMDIYAAFEIMKSSFQHGGKLLICGNGGSCSDSEHIVGELMKGFCKKRPLPCELRERLKEINPGEGEMIATALECGLPAIALSAHTALNTAFANDKNPDLIYAQEVIGYGNPDDVFWGISTSGNSKNVVYAMQVAKAKGLKTIALTGRNGGKVAKIADVSIIVPFQETYQIQEYHLPVYHTLCLMLEDAFFEN
ncbi:MAG: SIS domain-containing protein [Clostridiales bacterium]|nr:SIS domain-containing protein [Clostridiales bacterium]